VAAAPIQAEVAAILTREEEAIHTRVEVDAKVE
jgi:hypothetical protein